MYGVKKVMHELFLRQLTSMPDSVPMDVNSARETTKRANFVKNLQTKWIRQCHAAKPPTITQTFYCEIITMNKNLAAQ